jgi:phage FluMu gp28-like protein
MFSPAEKTVLASMALQNMNPEFKLDFWQRYYIENDNKFEITNKSRRIGYSWVKSGKSVIEAIDPDVKKYQQVFVSYGMHDAMGKISDAREFLMSLPDKYHKKLSSDSKTSLAFWDIDRKTKSQIISLPNRTLRGFGTSNKIGGICLDEFAYHQDDEKVYASAVPCLLRGGCLSIGSTPTDKIGKFYEIYSNFGEKHPEYKRITIPWWWASALCTDVSGAIKDAHTLTTHQRVDKYGTDYLKIIFNDLSLPVFQQEHECVFMDETNSFIAMEMIYACTPVTDPVRGTYEQYEYKDFNEFVNGVIINDIITGIDDMGQPIIDTISMPGYDPSVHGYLYAGVDIGRTKDSTIITLIGHRPDQNKKYVWMSYELKNKEFDYQKDVISSMMSELPIRKLLLDKNGLGRDLSEWAEKSFPQKAEGMDFTNESKEDMANKMYLGFERKEFVLPMNQKLHADIHCIRKTLTSTKHNRYDGNTKDSHADRFWSMALANMGILDYQTNESGFYSQYAKRKAGGNPVERKTTGNVQLDALIRRGRRYGKP